jgi:hypothetical protein
MMALDIRYGINAILAFWVLMWWWRRFCGVNARKKKSAAGDDYAVKTTRSSLVLCSLDISMGLFISLPVKEVSSRSLFVVRAE